MSVWKQNRKQMPGVEPWGTFQKWDCRLLVGRSTASSSYAEWSALWLYNYDFNLKINILGTAFDSNLIKTDFLSASFQTVELLVRTVAPLGDKNTAVVRRFGGQGQTPNWPCCTKHGRRHWGRPFVMSKRADLACFLHALSEKWSVGRGWTFVISVKLSDTEQWFSIH